MGVRQRTREEGATKAQKVGKRPRAGKRKNGKMPRHRPTPRTHGARGWRQRRQIEAQRSQDRPDPQGKRALVIGLVSPTLCRPGREPGEKVVMYDDPRDGWQADLERRIWFCCRRTRDVIQSLVKRKCTSVSACPVAVPTETSCDELSASREVPTEHGNDFGMPRIRRARYTLH